jgi:creatinine amidohydrolase/Fe(II)-dependent formamide hydrolase-like protein
MCIIARLSCLLLALLTLPVTNAVAQIYQVKEMNTEQIRALDREKTVVLLPGGILEQHGPYLPSFSDGYMSERLTQQLADAIVARSDWKVLIFPLIPLGNGGANIIGSKYSFAGSYSVRFTTLRAIFMDLATELGEQGFRWVFVLHHHGAPAHHRALDHAGDYFHDLYGGHMVNLPGLALTALWDTEKGGRTEKEREEDGLSVHSGMSETSRILFLRPDLVSPAVKDAPPLTGRNWDDLTRIAREKDWPGYFGSPRLASAAFGARVWGRYSATVVELAAKILDGFDYHQLPRHADALRGVAAHDAFAKAALEHEQQIKGRQLDWLKKEGLK